MERRPHRPAGQLAALAAAEVAVMTLWFSATAVLPSLRSEWGLSSSGAAWMTASVQLGFVAGALGSALLNLPDVLPPRPTRCSPGSSTPSRPPSRCASRRACSWRACTHRG